MANSRSTAAPPGAHEATLSPDGSRPYVAYGMGTHGVMQIINVSNLLSCRPTCPAQPQAAELLQSQVGRLDMPKFWGGHTAWPIIGIDVPEHAPFLRASPRDFVVLVLESVANACQEDAHHMVFMVDITDETRPFPVANYQVPESAGKFCQRGGRFGAHSLSWSYKPAFYKKLIVQVVASFKRRETPPSLSFEKGPDKLTEPGLWLLDGSRRRCRLIG